MATIVSKAEPRKRVRKARERLEARQKDFDANLKTKSGYHRPGAVRVK